MLAAARVPTPLPGREYFRAEALGEGACGAVMTVYDDDGGEWAAKRFVDGDDGTIDFTTLKEVALLALFRREALVHPHIVELHDMCEIDAMLCIVLPRLPTTLDSAIEGKAFRKQAEKLRVAQGLLSGVNVLHANGVMHRDIKTANVLLTNDMEPKLIDFSMAKVFAFTDAIAALEFGSDKKKKGKRKAKKHDENKGGENVAGAQNTGGCGTPAFMSPEVHRGEAYDGAKADMWSAGVCLMGLFNDSFHAEIVEVEREKLAHAKIAEVRAKLSPDKPLPSLLRRTLDPDVASRPSAREALLEVFALSGEKGEPPEEPLIRFLAGDAGESGKAKKTSRPGKEPSWFGFSTDEKEIKRWFDTFQLVNPLSRVAALAYLQSCRAANLAVTALSAVLLAGKMYEVEMPEPLDDLEFMHEWLDEMELETEELWTFDLDEYKEHEKAILRSMQYCLYVAPPAGAQR